MDRLSALPDALIHCVMSYLTARQAVQTCALSRRWRNLWRSAASLDVDSHMDDATRDHAAPPPVVVFVETPWEKLRDFATKLLQHHSAPFLDRFRLRVSTYRHDGDVKAEVAGWILRGASYRPAALEISLEHAARYVTMPPLGTGTGTTSSRLARLRLSGVLLDGGFASYLRTGCPVLRDLELKGCALDDFEEIVSGTLKSLTFYGCTAKRRRNADKWRVRVTAPCLLSIANGCGWGNVITLSTLLLSPQVNAERVVSTTREIILIIM